MEPTLAGLGYHCALGGGCLYKDGERKDGDIIIFPHGIANITRAGVEGLLKELEPLGFKPAHKTELPPSAELDKVVEVCEYKYTLQFEEGSITKTERIDLFFFDARPRFTDITDTTKK